MDARLPVAFLAGFASVVAQRSISTVMRCSIRLAAAESDWSSVV